MILPGQSSVLRQPQLLYTYNSPSIGTAPFSGPALWFESRACKPCPDGNRTAVSAISHKPHAAFFGPQTSDLVRRRTTGAQ